MDLGLIPARGGSKGVPGKNIRVVGGKPLIAWAIACALASPLDHVVVSTDSPAIAAIARDHGADAPFLRPADLAADTSPMLPVMRHAITACEAHYGRPVRRLVLLDPTGPLRQPGDVAAVLELLERPGTDAVVSANAAHRSPWFNMVRTDDAGYARLVIEPDTPVGRRQDAPEVYDLNTVAWGYTRAALMDQAQRLPARTRVHLVPPERAIDLDTELDFMILEALLARRAAEEAP